MINCFLKSRYIVIIPAILLFLIPIIGMGNYTNIGGDNSQFYYLEPSLYFNGYLTNMVGYNSLGGISLYQQQTYQLPFFAYLSALKFITPNILNFEAVAFGVAISSSYLSMYFLLRYMFDDGKCFAAQVCSLGGIFYATSLITYATFWSGGLYATYLVPLYPYFLLTILKTVNSDNYVNVVLGSILLTIFSVVLFSVPWFIGTVLCTLPLFFLFNNYYRVIKVGIIYAIVLFCFNAFWVIPFIDSTLNPTSFGYFGQDAYSSAGLIIDSVTTENNLMYPIFGTTMPRWLRDIEIPSIGSMPISGVLLSAAIIPILFVENSRQKFIILLSWLICIYFYTLNVVNYGVVLFKYLVDLIHPLAMFRNNFDKFSFALQFVTTIVLCFGLMQIFKLCKTKFYKFLYFFVVAIIVFSNYPFFRFDFYKRPFPWASNINTYFAELENDFYQMADFVSKNADGSRVLWLPLNGANWLVLPDKSMPNNYYIGTSIFTLLSGNTDLVGKYSFGNAKTGSEIFELLSNGKIEAAASLISKFGVKYIIVNNSLNRDLANTFMYTGQFPGDMYFTQMNLLLPEIAGKKVQDFGSSYSLYEIKDEYYKPLLFSSAKILNYKMSSEDRYDLQLMFKKGETIEVVLRQPFHNFWRLKIKSSLKQYAPTVYDESFILWELSSDQFINDAKNCLGSEFYCIELELKFERIFVFYIGVLISILTLIVAILYILNKLKKND